LRASDVNQAALAVARVGLGGGLVIGSGDRPLPIPAVDMPGHSDLVSRMQVLDMLSYLPDGILTKVDRCSMAVSLEAREPLLDHRLVEFVWSLPLSVRRGDGRSKAPLRAVLNHYLPRTLTDRPKRGFSIPLGEWLRGPLRDWAEALLDPHKLTSEGLFDTARVRTIWQRHLSGTEQNATGLWNILMVRAWSERWL
jgi:asparagine synthase (glutamine-hydrolysing)